MSPVHQHYPRFLCRLAATERCAGAPARLGLRSRAPAERVLGRVRRWAALAAVALLAAGCADALAESDAVDPSLRLEGSASSLDELGEHVLRALVDGDRATLEGYRLTERQHNEVVWPELPASRPEVNFPIDYAWRNIQSRNLRGVQRILPMYGGRDLTFRWVACRGEPQTFASFHVLTDCWVGFAADGREVWEAQLFKDVLVRGGGHKIFRYYDGEPRPADPSRAR